MHVLPDGEVVVFHDDDLLRATGVGRSLRDESRESIGRYRSFWTTHGIPSLAQALACLRGRVPILLEIKSQGSRPDSARHVLARLASYAGELAVQSFDPFSSTSRWRRGRHSKITRVLRSGLRRPATRLAPPPS
jgi:glycerophosphoryl diester phosphodiesterase